MNKPTYESFYNVLFTQAKFGIIICGFDGRFLEVNPFVCGLLGYSGDELVKLSVRELWHPEDLRADPLDITPIVKGETIIKERRIRKKDGDYITAEIHVQKLEENLALMLLRDISLKEQTLKLSQERYRQIAEFTTDVIWMMDERLNYIYVSPSIFRQRGFTQEEFLNLKPEERYTEESQKKVLEASSKYIKLAAEGKIPGDFSFTLDLQHFCKDGSVRDSEIIIGPVFDQNNKLTGAHGVSRDVTERKILERKHKLVGTFLARLLRTSNLFEIHDLLLDTVGQLVPDEIIFTTDINLKIRTGRIVGYRGIHVPPGGLKEFFGTDPLELRFDMASLPTVQKEKYQSGKLEILDFGLFELSAMLLDESFARQAEEKLKIKHIYYIGYIYQDAHHGGLVFLSNKDMTGNKDTIEMIVTQAAIAMNRIKAEESLKEAEERFRLSFYTSPDSINLNEFESGKYIEVNEGFTLLTGYTKEEVIGKNSLEVSIWADISDRLRLIEILRKVGMVRNFEARFRLKDGTIRTGLMSATVIRLNGVMHILSITHDIENIKRAEQELLMAKESAEEASRIKTSFLNNISHEVRTPMNAILGFTELLQSDDLDKAERERYFGIINSNTRQLLSIIDDVLEISRLDSGRIPFHATTFSVADLMDDIHLSMGELVTSKGLKFIHASTNVKKSDTVIADQEKIRQVITGLIGNAVKFTSSGSITFGFDKKEKEIEFYVRDTGIGIPREEFGNIFERFYQVEYDSKNQSHGTGLGLSIAQGLAEVMNGKLHVESEPGSGSVFTLVVPFREPVVASTAKELSKQFSIDVLKILVAEDEDNNFELLRILLSKRTKNILRASNGQEALEILKNHKPDLVLMDLKMPVMDGYEATRKAMALYPDLRIIALTAYTQPEEENRALEAGCCAFISKPIRNQELLETIQRSLRK